MRYPEVAIARPLALCVRAKLAKLVRSPSSATRPSRRANPTGDPEVLSQTSLPGKGGHLPTEKDKGNGNAPLSGEDESKVVVSEVVVVRCVVDGRARHGASNGCFREEEERDGKVGERSGRGTYARGGRMDTWDACRCECMENLAAMHVQAVFVPVKLETNHA